MGPGATLQDDNAIPHRDQVITDFLPPTLQIWLLSMVGQRVVAKKQQHPMPVDVKQLTHFLQQEWQNIPQ